MDQFILDPATGDIHVARRSGENECAYLIREAAFKTRTACRAREIALIPALSRRVRAVQAIDRAEDALSGLDALHRPWAAAQLRRLRRLLDWSG